MSGRFLLDTNVVIAVFANDLSVLAIVSQADACFLPAIARGELIYGAHRSQKAEDNLARIDAFCDRFALLACDRETADKYGLIKSQLHRNGRPIPENDIWIAAIAMQHPLNLLSNDEHFKHVRGVSLTGW